MTEAAIDDSVVLSDRAGGLVVQRGAVVSKTHPAGTDRAALAARLTAAAHPLLREVLLPPRSTRLEVTGDRPVTHWPAGEPVRADDPDAAPWEHGAALLAALHRVPAAAVFGPASPPSGGPARLARGMAELAQLDSPAARVVTAAFRTLPAWVRHQEQQPGGMLTHGDWHLGQLVRVDGRWSMIDIDDLGAGEAAWDLARPAAYFSAGLLPAEVWHRFLAAYRAAGGPAVPATGDPWPTLDLPARGMAVQMAAHSVVKAAQERRKLDELEEALVETCQRIVAVAAGHETIGHC